MMITATTFVMLMTPAMGIAQAGMIRRKNALSMIMQTMAGMVIGSLLWFVAGFPLVFGDSAGGWMGNPLGRYGFCFAGLSATEPLPTSVASADTIPGILFASYHMMFALMTPVIVTGAWAERMTFEAFLIFVTVWPVLVYYPLAHWIWHGNGVLAAAGVVDFAGGLVIHASSGAAALPVVLMLQRRRAGQEAAPQHHNLPLSTLGAALIWGGWYSFNGGSAYKAGPQAASALLNTHLSACAGAATWVIAHFLTTRQWAVTAMMNGVFAGLGAVTAGSGFIGARAAVCAGVLGATSGILTIRMKDAARLDDVLDVMALQGMPGIVGSIWVGFAAQIKLNPGLKQNGLLYGGGWALVRHQILGAVVACCWSAGWTWVIMKLIDYSVGIDVSPDAESIGLDLVQVGEPAYDHDIAGSGDLYGDASANGLRQRHQGKQQQAAGSELLTERLIDAAANGNLVKVRRLVTQFGAAADAQDYDGRSAAHLAAANGHLDILRELIRFGANLHARDRWGATPLREAVENEQDQLIPWFRDNGAHVGDDDIAQEKLCDAASRGSLREVTRLLAAGVDPASSDYDKRGPCHLACAAGHDDVLRALLQAAGGSSAHLVAARDRWGGTPSDDARRAKDGAACLQLLEQHASSSASTARPANGRGHSSGEEATSLLVLSGPASTKSYQVHPGSGAKSGTSDASSAAFQLCSAAAAGNLAELKRLLKKLRGSNIESDYDNRSCLHMAASSGRCEALELLLATPSVAAHVNALDRQGHTPLYDALQATGGDEHSDFARAAQILRTAGGVVLNATHVVALCRAAANDDLAALQKAHQAHENLGVADYDNRTPLHLASSEGHTRCIEWLLSIGVPLNPVDNWGGTPLRDAIRLKRKDAVTMLREAGACEL